MSLERPPQLSLENAHEAPPEAIETLDTLHEQALSDPELMASYELVVGNIQDYAIAKIRHVKFSENDLARQHLAEQYEDKFNAMNFDRTKAHNRLLESLGTFVDRAKELTCPTEWWDGPQGLTKETSRQTVRQRVDDWAMDIWLAWEEEQEQNQRKTKKARKK